MGFIIELLLISTSVKRKLSIADGTETFFKSFKRLNILEIDYSTERSDFRGTWNKGPFFFDIYFYPV